MKLETNKNVNIISVMVDLCIRKRFLFHRGFGERGYNIKDTGDAYIDFSNLEVGDFLIHEDFVWANMGCLM